MQFNLLWKHMQNKLQQSLLQEQENIYARTTTCTYEKTINIQHKEYSVRKDDIVPKHEL